MHLHISLCTDFVDVGLLFHRRHAEAIVQCWNEALSDGMLHPIINSKIGEMLTMAIASTNRKLNLIYLANEVSQQSRVKRRTEYPEAFGKVIAPAVANILRHVPADVQGKVRRVVDVWRQRTVFAPDVLARLDVVVKEKPGSVISKPVQATPPALKAVTEAYRTLDELMASMSLSAGTTDILLGMAESSTEDVESKLNQVTASIDNVEKLLQSASTAREAVIAELRALLEINEAAQADQENQARQWQEKRAQVEEKKANARSTTPEMEPPPAEALTPPPIPPTSSDPVSRLEFEMESDLAALLAKHAPTIQPTPVEAPGDEEEYIP